MKAVYAIARVLVVVGGLMFTCAVSAREWRDAGVYAAMAFFSAIALEFRK